MNSKPKIAYVYFDSFDYRTAHISQIANMLSAFADQSQKVTLITGWINEKRFGDILEELSVNRKFIIKRMPVKFISGNIIGEFIGRFIFSIFASFYVFFNHFDFIYTRDFFFLMFLSFTPSVLRHKNIVFESHRLYSEVFYSDNKKIPVSIERKALHIASKIITVSAITKDDYVNKFSLNENNIAVVSNGVNTEIFNPKPINRENIILYSGSFLGWKGVDTIIESFKYINNSDYWFYIIGGSQEEVNNFQKIIKEENILYDKIKIIPQISQKELIPYLNRAKIAILSNRNVVESQRYTSPLKLFEYLAMGLAIICSDMPSMKSILKENENAIFFEPENPKNLAEKITFLMNNQELIGRISSSNIKSAQSLTWTNRAENIIKFVMAAKRETGQTKVCIIASQILGSKKIGGFGSMTRQLAISLADAGMAVAVAVPNRTAGIAFLHPNIQIKRLSFTDMINPSVFKKINADIYHSQNQTIMTLTAMIAEPVKKHVVTSRDPRDLKDWYLTFKHADWIRRFKIPFNYLLEEGFLARIIMKRADIIGCPAYFLQPKITRMYGLKKQPVFMPNIEKISETVPTKSDKPTVCFVGRFEKIKKPEQIIALAKKFPEVDFIMVGKSEEDGYQKKLTEHISTARNIRAVGYINKFDSEELYKIYDKSWILINASVKEGLPLTFVEAVGRGCAILSRVNPDNFASEFGYWARNDDFEQGLKYLLEGNRWRRLGEKGHLYVYENYRQEKSLQVHLDIYNSLLQQNSQEPKIELITFLDDYQSPDAHKISVIIPTFGRETIKSALDSLRHQTLPPHEIIVVYDDKQRGVGWARNKGIKKSSGDLIGFLDDDCVAPDNWLANLVSAIDRHNAAGAGGTYQESDSLLSDARLRRKFPTTESEDNGGCVGVGGNVMYKKEWLDKLFVEEGCYFNEEFDQFRGAEDWDVAWRLRSKNAKLIFVPVNPLHLRKVSFIQYFRLQIARGTAIYGLYKSHRERKINLAAQKSLLWSDDGSSMKKARYFKILWLKIVGPFDVSSFANFKNYLIFWVGEKFQGLGFISALIKDKLQ